MTDTTTNISNIKIHKDKYIYASSYIGGPLAAGYIIADNFKSFGENKKYKQTLVATIVVTALLFTVVMITPGIEKVPSYLIPLSYTFLSYGLIRWFQGKQIDKHIANGGKLYSPWRAVLITILSLIVTLLLVLFLAYFIIPDEKTEIFPKKFGPVNHQIQFNPANFEKSEVSLLSDRLAEIQYLDSTYTMTLFVDKERNQIQIWIPFSEPAWTYPEDLQRHTQLKDILTNYYPDNKIVINLCDSNWTIKRTIK